MTFKEEKGSINKILEKVATSERSTMQLLKMQHRSGKVNKLTKAAH